MLDFEVGSADFWISFGPKDKPFPVTIYKQAGNWVSDPHPSRALTESEQIELNSFVKERIGDMKHIWKNNMSTRLHWELTGPGAVAAKASAAKASAAKARAKKV